MALVELAIVANEMEADMLCGELRANGIECMHRATGIAAHQFGSSMTSVTFGAGVPTAVFVDERDLDRARALLPRG
jgi:Putative prokaryotic signal transducing protein